MILSAMFEASITIVRQVSAEGKALGRISCTESHMPSVARFEEGCECEAKVASRQPAGAPALHGCDAGAGASCWRYTATSASAQQLSNARMI